LSDRDGDDARVKLHQRAADFFAHQRRPIGRWQTIEDVSPQLQEFDQRVKAGEYDLAAEVLLMIDRDYLWEWNQKALLAESHGRLQGHLTDASLARASRRRLGWTHWPDVQQAAPIFEQNLSEARQAGDQQAEADALDDLAQVRRYQANWARALELHEQALGLYRAIGDWRGEGEALGGAAQALTGLGQIERAMAYNEQALAIQRALNHLPSIGFLLGAQGTLYGMQGQFERAIAHYTAAIGVYGELNSQRGIANSLAQSAFVYANLGEFERALESASQAADTYRALRNVEDEVMAHMMGGIARVLKGDAAEAIAPLQSALAPEVHNMVTRSFAGYFLVTARIMVGQITEARELRATMPPSARPTPALGLKVMDGLIAARLGETDLARMTFQAAIDFAAQLSSQVPNGYEVPYWCGLAEAGLALLDRSDAHLTTALADYATAREACTAEGVISLRSHLLDALMACPGGEFLQAAQAALHDRGH
jgi:tetratricopeptide (TPR) repeat protein